MLDLIIYLTSAGLLALVGWDDRNRPFDPSQGVPVAQEERNLWST